MARPGFLRLAPWLNGDAPFSVEGRMVMLRAPQLDDFESWCTLRLESRAFLEPWEPSWDDAEYTRAAFRLRVRRYQSAATEDQAHAFFIFSKTGSELLGGITLSNIRRGIAQTGSLGYWTGARHANKGYMTDALSALVPHAFNHLNLHRLEAACLPRNHASAQCLQNAGFRQEGYAKSYLKINGAWEDHLLFARLAVV